MFAKRNMKEQLKPEQEIKMVGWFIAGFIVGEIATAFAIALCTAAKRGDGENV